MTHLQKIFVFLYRNAAAMLLGSVLFGAAYYFVTMGLYTVNRSWAAPMILSKATPRVMSTSAEAFRARQGLSALEVEIAALTNGLSLLEKEEASLSVLHQRFETAVTAEAKAAAAIAGRLGSLQGAKRADDAKATKLASANASIERSIEAELAAGLITQEAAARARAQVVTMESAVTAGKLSTVALDQQVQEIKGGVSTLNGMATSTKALETLARIAALDRQLAETRIQLQKGRSELANKTREADSLRSLLATVEETPFFRIAQGQASQFAFVPYENESAAKVGQSVYSCWAKVLLCSKVGSVKWVGAVEEKGFHPIFQRDIRGFMIQLDLTDPQAAKDQVLFLGSGPLYI